jgi:hypothetical protein
MVIQTYHFLKILMPQEQSERSVPPSDKVIKSQKNWKIHLNQEEQLSSERNQLLIGNLVRFPPEGYRLKRRFFDMVQIFLVHQSDVRSRRMNE